MADEPTTGLDVTIQAQILNLLDELKERLQMSVILVTHDLGVVATRTSRIIVMYAGRIVEIGSTRDVFARHRMPYTRALLEGSPKVSNPSHTRLLAIPGRPPNLLDLPPAARSRRAAPTRPTAAARSAPNSSRPSEPGHAFACWHPLPRHREGSPRERRRHLCSGSATSRSPSACTAVKRVSAVAGVSFDIFEGETLGLVGESGCGKSTTGKALMRIVEPSSGSIELEGTELTTTSGKALRNLRTRMQMIFQDPISSLNPRRRVKDIVAEPLDCWKTRRGRRARRRSSTTS